MFRQWLSELTHVSGPLFACDADNVVGSTELRTGRRILCRHPDMERMIVDQVTRGLKSPDWTGLLYVMGWGRTISEVRPLYVGRTGRLGKKGNISANIADISRDRSHFARWGHGRYYHIGDLSHAVFHPEAKDHSAQKYGRWADTLFLDRSALILREQPYLFLFPWTSQTVDASGAPIDLVAAEDLAIRLAIEDFEELVLNIQGERWWAPASRTNRYTEGHIRPEKPIRWVDDRSSLQLALADLNQADVIGLDVETTLYTQELCLVQLATQNQTWLFDARSLDPELLKPVLEAPTPLKLVHNASFERRILSSHGISLGNTYDTYRASRRMGQKPHGLAHVCERLLKRTLDKSCQRSDWARRPLSAEQIDYAALDAEVLLPLYAAFLHRMPDLPFAK